jgi:hypothetical protein
MLVDGIGGDQLFVAHGITWMEDSVIASARCLRRERDE